MRNLKKLLAVIVAICVLASFTVPAFAATSASFTYADQAKKLYDMKLYAGNSATSYVPDLGSKLTREQGIILLVRMFGKEKDALAMTDADTVLAKYTDAAKVSSWAKKYVAYAVKTTMVSGTTATTLDAAGKLTGNAMATMILKNLGFTVDPATYATNAATLSSKGGLTADEATKFASKELIRDDVVGIMFGSLKAKDSNGKVVIDNLVASGAVSADAAKAAGLYTSVALDVSSAVAINSKVVEVKLGTAATAADVAGAPIAVKDSADKAINVTSKELAKYDADGKTMLVTLEADTTIGTLYTMSIGEKTVKFGGKAKDTTKPEIVANGIKSTDYNEVTIEFNEPVKLDGATIVITEKYGSKAALEVKSIAYDGSNKLKLVTGAQKGSLYGVTATGVKDFSDNVMDKDDAKTFVGQEMSTADQVVDAAKAIDYNKVAVKFKVNVDPTTIASATYTVEETFGTKTTFAVTAAAATTTDAGDYDSSFTDAQKSDFAKKAVILTLTSGAMKDSTLYKVTVAGVKTLYGKAMSTTTADTYKTFTGMSKPTGAFGYASSGYAAAKSNTTVELKFERKLDKAAAEVTANYAIALAYGTKTALAVSKAELKSDAKTVKLTVAAMTGDLYKATVTNLKDIYGNTVKTGDDASKTFVGVAAQSKIDGITSITRPATNGDTSIIVKFNKNVGTSAKDVSHYVIDNDIGYPSKAETTDNADEVKLTIPKTIDQKTYKLTVKGLENADGVAMGADGVSTTFSGKGISATLPAVEYVVTMDKNTIGVFFDRDVKDSKIDGILWTSSNNQLATSKFSFAPNKSPLTETVLPSSTYALAYQSPDNKNCLIIRYDANGSTAGVGTPFAAGNDYNSFKFILKDTTKSKYTTDSATYIEFAASAKDTAKPAIDGVMGMSNHTFKIFFTEPVANVDTGDFVVKKKGTTTALALSSVYSVNGTDGKEWLVTTNAASANAFSADAYEVTTTVAGINSKYLLANTLKPDTDGGATCVKELAGNSSSTDYITDVYAVMPNDHVIEVYYPETMNIAASNAEATGTTQADYKGSYSLKKVDGTTNLTSAPTITDVEYDNNTNKAIIYLNGAIGSTQTSDNTFKLVIDTAVANLTNTKTIAASSAASDAGNPLKVEVPKSTKENNGPTIASATVAGDRMSMDIVMSEDVAFGATVAMDTDAVFNNAGSTAADNALFARKDSANAYDMTVAEFVKAFQITAKFAGDTTTVTLKNGGTVTNTNYISSVTRKLDGKTLTVNFTKALVAGLEGTVTTEAGTLAIKNKSFVAAKTASDTASSVKFAIPNSTAYDYTAPQAVSAALYDKYVNANIAATGDFATANEGHDGIVDTAVITFSEDISYSASAADWAVSAGTAYLSAAGFAQIKNVSIDGAKLTINFAKYNTAANGTGTAVTNKLNTAVDTTASGLLITYTQDTNNKLKDLAGNAWKNNNATPVEVISFKFEADVTLAGDNAITLADAAAPVLISVTASDASFSAAADTMALKYSETVTYTPSNTTLAAQLADFNALLGTISSGVFSFVALNGDTMPGTVSTDTVTFTITDGTTDGIGTVTNPIVKATPVTVTGAASTLIADGFSNSAVVPSAVLTVQ